MSRADTLSIEEKILAVATKSAIQAAGGLEVLARETGLSTSQLSRCSSRDHRDSITIRDAATIEVLADGSAGTPYITRALARVLGYVLVKLPEGPEDADGLLRSVLEMTAELGDVSKSIADALRDQTVTPKEAQRALDELDELDEKSAALRVKLRLLADGKLAGAHGSA